jgi:tetratricopeptide (TPR) repeat protein
MVNATTSAPAGAPDSFGEDLSRALELLDQQPRAALDLALKILAVARDHPVAMLVSGIAQRLSNDPSSAVTTLERLTRLQPRTGVAHYEHGLALAASGRGEAAIDALRRAVELNPSIPGAWLVLANHLTAVGQIAAADAAYAQHVKSATSNPRLLRAAAALCENDIPTAEALLRRYLQQHPTDVAAIRMLAEVAARIGRFTDAATLLTRCVELAPGFTEARAQYAGVLGRLNRPLEALREVDGLLATQPRNPSLRNLKATTLVSIGEYAQSLKLYADLLEEYPRQAKLWLSYGHVLKTAGRQQDAVQAYRRCIDLSPNLGEAWFTLANLKTFRFSDAEVEAMRSALSSPDISDSDRVHLDFALGKACEDAGQFASSFEHYKAGNELRRSQIHYDAQDTTSLVERSCALFTREFFAERAGVGAAAADPIFVVGLPRAGSTLVDQILCSHSMVEGTMELHDLINIAHGVKATVQYPQALEALAPDQIRAMGQQYLERTRIHRKEAKAHFVDKMPNNFLHVGLIALALPNAKIIDVRRHPLGCCFSVFKQHFARGQSFSYDLADIGRYYRDYVSLMSHIDAVLPGRVHRVHYESLVEDTEKTVRQMLDYCGLAFEEDCLRFYENKRAVRTASSEQVRKPIFRDGVDQWRNYEPWLAPLKTALGPVLDNYPSSQNRS